MNRLLLVAVSAMALTGCHDYADDVAIICDAPDKIDVPADAKSAVKLSAIGPYLDEHVKTKDGRALMMFLGNANRATRSKVLRNIAMENGLPSCHLADMN